MNRQLLNKINTIELLCSKSKWQKIAHRPFNYCFSIFYRFVFYKIFKQSIRLKTTTFFDEKLWIDFPSCNDIFITGAKTHSSEIRLTKFLIKNLKTDETFIDIGAHVGFFSLLASKLIGKNGLVFSFEPTQKTFQLLKANTAFYKNILTFNLAMSDEDTRFKHSSNWK